MSDQVQFLNNLTPLIDSGTPSAPITVTQTLNSLVPAGSILAFTGPTSVNIQVNGPQTSLTQSDISGVYPAAGSLDSPDDYLPHIALHRRTLPWERKGPGGAKPWLALLLLKDSELKSLTSGGPIIVGNLPISNLPGNLAINAAIKENIATTPASGVGKENLAAQPVSGAAKGPIIAQPIAAVQDHVSIVRNGNSLPALVTDVFSKMNARDAAGYASLHGKIADTTQVQMLYLQNSLFTAIAPAQNELVDLCTVKRVNRDNTGDVDTAIVIGNRLPDASATPPELHTAFLVSLEGRDDAYAAARTQQPNGQIGLVVLFSWSFTPSKGGDFEEVIRAIHIRPNGGVERFGNLPKAPDAGKPVPLSGGFDALLDDHGFFIDPLDHTQAGKATFRGPLRPFPPPPRSKGFAIRSAPEEFTDATPDTPLDYSNATAFELGRLLAVASQDLLEDLHQVRGIIKTIDKQYVAVNKLPLALQKPEWVVDPALEESSPWEMGQANAMTPVIKNENQFVGATPGDVSGVGQQIQQYGSQVQNVLTTIGAVSTVAVSQIDINTVTANDLNLRFGAVAAKGQF
ncbi:MAG TPA: hypothetical protein VGN16_26150 [Acidobacteriaceae bacterium]|jgi:hypothetical protein